MHSDTPYGPVVGWKLKRAPHMSALSAHAPLRSRQVESDFESGAPHMARSFVESKIPRINVIVKLAWPIWRIIWLKAGDLQF